MMIDDMSIWICIDCMIGVCLALRSVVLPDSIIVIQFFEFYNCVLLSSIRLS